MVVDVKISSTEKKLSLFMDRACVCQRDDDSVVIGKAVVGTLFKDKCYGCVVCHEYSKRTLTYF